MFLAYSPIGNDLLEFVRPFPLPLSIAGRCCSRGVGELALPPVVARAVPEVADEELEASALPPELPGGEPSSLGLGSVTSSELEPRGSRASEPASRDG